MKINAENLLYNKMMNCRENNDDSNYKLIFDSDFDLRFEDKPEIYGTGLVCLGEVDCDEYYKYFDNIYSDNLLDIVYLYINSSDKERKNLFSFTLEDSVSNGYKKGTISLYTPRDFSDYLKGEDDDLLDKESKLKDLGLSSYEELEALDPERYVIEDSCDHTGFLRLFHR